MDMDTPDDSEKTDEYNAAKYIYETWRSGEVSDNLFDCYSAHCQRLGFSREQRFSTAIYLLALTHNT